MVTDEYLRVSELAKKKKITVKTVRNKIQKLLGLVGDDKIIKDNNGDWRIHRSLLSKFDPERIHKTRYSAITIDPVYNYSTGDLVKIMQWVLDNINAEEAVLNFTIEQKKVNSCNHLHIYLAKDISVKFLKMAKVAFPRMSYYAVEVYDLDGWKNYIKKDGCSIITIKK